MADLEVEEVRFIQTEDGYLRTVLITTTEGTTVTALEVEIGVRVGINAAGLIHSEFYGSGSQFAVLFDLAARGKTIAEARALARALDRAADKAALRQIIGGA